MNLALCLIYLQLCFVISNTVSVKQSGKYYILNSLSDGDKLDKPAPVTYLRFHPNHTADPWIVYKKPTWESTGKHNVTNKKNSMQSEKNVLRGKVLRYTLGRFTNYFDRVVKALAQAGQFTAKYRTSISKHYGAGTFNETSKTWDGGIGDLQNDEIDISAYPYSSTSERRKAVDLSIPLATGRLCLIIKRPSSKVSFRRSGYLQPFAINVWCGMLLLLLVALALLTFMKKKLEKKLHYGRYIPKQFLQLWGILCQQGLSEFPRTSSHGTLYYAILWFGLIVYTLYSSLIVSDIVSNEDSLPFSSMEEFAENKVYKLTVLKNRRFYLELKNSNNNERYPYNLLRNKLMKDEELPTIEADLWNQICNEKVAALYFNLIVSEDYEGFVCQLSFICAPWPHMQMSFAFQKNGQYTQALNYNIMKLKEDGILDRMQNKHLSVGNTFFHRDDPEVIYQGVTVTNISTLFPILLSGMILALIALFFEKVHIWFYEKQTTVIRVAPLRPAAARIRNDHDIIDISL